MKTCGATIIAARVRAVELPLFTPFAISKGTLEQAHLSFVTLEDANGCQGIGEIASFPQLTGDSPLACFEAAKQYGAQLVGHDSWRAMANLLKVRPDFLQTPTTIVGFEMALWDLRAKQLGVPLARLWGHESQTQYTTDITLPIMDLTTVRKFSNLFSKHKFDTVKVKVGGETEIFDCERILELKKCMPFFTHVTLDGNQGCTVESSLKLIDTLAKCNIVPLFFEQPLAADDWVGMERLTRKSPIPICADETVKTVADAIDVINRKAAHCINLKFMKSGIQETLDIIGVARAKNLKLMIGGMLESEVGMTCSAHAVCGTGAIDWCDLDTPFFIEQRVTVDSPYHQSSSTLELSSRPGLGLELCL